MSFGFADSPRSAYEVELVNQDGSTVEVHLDADYKVIAIDRDQPDASDDNDGRHDNDTSDSHDND